MIPTSTSRSPTRGLIPTGALRPPRPGLNLERRVGKGCGGVELLSLSRLADSYRSANVSAFRRIALRNRHPAVSARCSHLGVQRIAFSSFVQKVAFRRRRYGVPHARPSVDRNAVSRECSNCAAGAVLLGAAATRAGPRKLMVAGGVRQSGAVLQPSLRGPSA
jgi:hypothetical protein